MAHRRRAVGIKGLEKRESFQKVGSNLKDEQTKQMEEQLNIFKMNLETFAKKYKNKINQNPEFRQQFQTMCTNIGVDPLASNKGFWSELLGFGDFYYHLSVQIVEVCLKTRSMNGGLIELNELRTKLEQLRGTNAQKISNDDIERAIKKLKVFGEGFNVLTLGDKKMVQSVPMELSSDSTSILVLAQKRFSLTQQLVMTELGWTNIRTQTALNVLMQEGLAWVDDQAEGGREYWFLSLALREEKV